MLSIILIEAQNLLDSVYLFVFSASINESQIFMLLPWYLNLLFFQPSTTREYLFSLGGSSNNSSCILQHGPYECLLNTVEACAISAWPDLVWKTVVFPVNFSDVLPNILYRTTLLLK